jgi:phage-related protein
MKDITSAFRQEKNKLESAAVVTMYDIEITDTVTLHITDYDKDVIFGIPYYAFPVKRSEIDQNMLNQITSMSLSIANANRVYGGYLELYDGLIGNKVVITTTFENLLGDVASGITEEYYVKSSQANQGVIVLNLVSKLDIMDYQLPGRTFETNFCQWSYKGLGCWEESDDINWGIKSVLPNTQYHPDVPCFVGGGSSLLSIPAGQVLKGVAYRGYGPNDIRLAIYQGSAVNTPYNASLFYDLGKMSVPVANTWYTKTIPTALQPEMSPYVYWIAIKAGGVTNQWTYTTGAAYVEDFPSAVGLLVNGSMNSSPSVAFEATVPTGNSEAFPREWPSMYLIYGDPEGYVQPSGFTGGGVNCDHTLDGASGCEWHNNEVRFGGFFSIPQDIRILRI